MLTDILIRQAVEFESAGNPVLSVYLNVDPHRRTAEKYKLALRALLAQVPHAPAADRQKIQNYVEMGYNWQGRGLIMFSCHREEFWWAENVAVGIEDAVLVSHRPYVHQLATLIETHDRLGVIHINQMGAQLYLYRLGNLEAVEGYLGEEVRTHRGGGWAAQRYQRHEAETARQNLHDAATLAEEFYQKNGTERLVLAGTDKNVARFREMLSHRLQALVIGDFPAHANVTPAEIQQKTAALATNSAKESGQRVADQIITAARKNSNGVLGLADTLNVVQTGRAQHVVLLAGYSQPAFRHKESGYVVLDASAPDDNEALEALPDAVDSVLRRALLQEIGVTVLTAHAELDKAGKIGALTRY